MDLTNWHERILEAAERIRPLVHETPLQASALSIDGPTRVLFKLEQQQHTGSFKFRGATSRISLLTPDQASAGVIAASNGNHGLAVAAAAGARGIAAEIYVSAQVSPSKLERIEQYGASIRHAGLDPLAAEIAAREAARQSHKVYISPYNDIDVIAGQGTIGVEMHRQALGIDAVFVAVGGGGLIGGIGAYLQAVSPETEIIGCWPEHSPVLYECLKVGRIIDTPERPTLSESTAGGLEPDSITLDLCRRVIGRSVLVSENEILDAMRRVLETHNWMIEGAAGVAVAGLNRERRRYQGKTVAAVVCGGNLSKEVLRRLRE